MTRFVTLIGLLLAALFVAEPVVARDTSASSLNRKRHEAVKRWESSWELSARGQNSTASPGVKNITFSNPKASRV